MVVDYCADMDTHWSSINLFWHYDHHKTQKLKYYLSILLIILAVGVVAKAQKVKPYKYNYVDSVIAYYNAEIIVYKQKGLVVRDTLWLPLKYDVNINEAGVVLNKNRKLKKYHTKITNHNTHR